MATYGRKEAALTLVEQLGFSHKEAALFVDNWLNLLIDSIVVHHEVKMAGFGVFRVRYKHERVARNPKTGSPAVVSARYVVRFSGSKQLNHRLSLRRPSGE
jgi:DNA-binding protein HU-beta